MAMTKFGSIARKLENGVCESDSSLNEAVFNKSKLVTVARLYGGLLKKVFGSNFYIQSEEKFKSPSHSGFGIRLVSEASHQVRFNFTSVNAGIEKDKLFVSSIDYWDPLSDVDLTKPTLTCKFNQEVNVVKIWDKVFKALRDGRKGLLSLHENLRECLTEADIGTPEKRKAFAKYMGFSDVYGGKLKSIVPGSKEAEAFSKRISGELKGSSKDLSAQWETFTAEIYDGEKETNSFEDACVKADQDLEKTRYCDPDFVFDDIELLTRIAVSGWQQKKPNRTRCFLLTGLGGLGKTYHVEKVLGEMLGKFANRDDVYYAKGLKATTFAFYKAMFTARDKLMYLDEADQIFKDDDTIKMLKAAWDTSETIPGYNIVNYATNTIPVNGQDNIFRYMEIASMLEKQGKVPAQIAGKKVGEFNLLRYDYAFGDDGIDDGYGDDDEDGDGDSKSNMTPDEWLRSLDFIPLPSNFYYSGSAICISNMKMSSIDQAVASRCTQLDLLLSGTDIFRRMQTLELVNKWSADPLAAAKKIAIIAKSVGLELDYDPVTGTIHPSEKLNRMYEKKQLKFNMRDLKRLNEYLDHGLTIENDAAVLERLIGYQISKRG